MAVSADKILTSTYDTVFSLLNTYAYSVIDASSNTITLVPWSTGNYWTGAYPHWDIDDKDSYPLGVLHTATSTEGAVTYGADLYETGIEVEVFSTKGQHAALFAEKIMKEMKDNESTLMTAGLKLKKTPTTIPSFTMRDKIRIHSIIIAFRFEVISVR